MLRNDPKRVSAAVNGLTVRMDARRVADWRSGRRILRKLENNYCTKCAMRKVKMKGMVNELGRVRTVDEEFLIHTCQQYEGVRSRG